MRDTIECVALQPIAVPNRQSKTSKRVEPVADDATPAKPENLVRLPADVFKKLHDKGVVRLKEEHDLRVELHRKVTEIREKAEEKVREQIAKVREQIAEAGTSKPTRTQAVAGKGKTETKAAGK